MTNTKVLAFFAVLVLLATAVYRVVTGRSKDGYHTLWAAGLLSIGLSVLTDLQPGLGAIVAVVVIMFFVFNMVRQPKGTWSLPQANNNQGVGTTTAAPATPVLGAPTRVSGSYATTPVLPNNPLLTA